MKRKIVVTTESVSISAIINTNGSQPVRAEVEQVRDALANSLMRAASELPFLQTPISHVRVR